MPVPHRVRKIVSGGQTGVDRGALDVAIFLEIPHGGWCPLGRRAEDGEVPPIYELNETETRDYTDRTRRNVVDSDGTLILYAGQMSGGTELTRRLANRHRRALLCVDLEADEHSLRSLVTQVQRWLQQSNIQVLNIAGPRESSRPGISQSAQAFLLAVFRDNSA